MPLPSEPDRRRPWSRLSAMVGLAVLVLGAGSRALAHGHDMDMGDGSSDPDNGKIVRSTREYAVPAVRLVRQDGKAVSLPDEMNDGRPVVLNFIFTTCTDICPMMSAVFSQFEKRLGADVEKVHLMSISIDPEQDTPARLVEYAKRFHAGPEWQHYTGTREASITTQRAFGVYNGGKMSHGAVTLMRAAPGKRWLRIDGFATPDELVHDYRGLVASDVTATAENRGP
jgi:protein SCO1